METNNIWNMVVVMWTLAILAYVLYTLWAGANFVAFKLFGTFILVTAMGGVIVTALEELG